MRKKELLALALPVPTEEMLRTAREDTYTVREYGQQWRYGTRKVKSYGTRLYYAAMVNGEYLIASAWARASLAEGKMEPLFTIYIDVGHDKWKTLEDGKWTDAMIDTVAGRHSRQRHTDIMAAVDVHDWESTSLCRRLLGNDGGINIYNAIDRWQKEKKDRENRKRAEKKKAYWDSMMALIPPVPEDFEEWADKEGTWDDHFLMFRKKGKRYEVYCTRCGRTYETDKRMFHSPGKPTQWNYGQKSFTAYCENCYRGLTAKSWGKQKGFRTHSYVMLPQVVETAEGRKLVALRQFGVTKIFKRASSFGIFRSWEYETVILEKSRVFADPQTFVSVESYEEREVPYIGYCWSETRTWHYPKSGKSWKPESDYVGRAYAGGVPEIAACSYMPEKLVRVCLERCSPRNSPQLALRTATRARYLEYMYRSGLERMADDIINHGTGGKGIDQDAKTLKGLLGIDGQQLRILKDINGSFDMLQNIKDMAVIGEKADLETLRYMNDNDIRFSDLPMERTGMNLQRTMNYLRKQAEIQDTTVDKVLRVYRDYLDLAEMRGMDLRDEIVCRAPKMRQLHDRYVLETEQEKNSKRDEAVDRKFTNICRDKERNDEHFAYSRDGLVIIVPGRASDITAEGRAQHHCVGASDTYIKKMDERETFILFLRSQEAPDNPYYTLEVEYDGRVVQAYGAYDRKPDKEKVDAFLAAFTRQVRKRTEKEQAEAGGVTAEGRVLCAAV